MATIFESDEELERKSAELDRPEDLATVDVAKPDISELGDFLRRTEALVPLAIVGIFILGFIAFLRFSKEFLLPVVLAVVLNFLLKPIVKALAKIHLSEPLGAVMVIAAFVGVISFGASQLAEPAREWAANAPEKLRDAGEKVRHWTRPAEKFSKVAEQVEDITKGKNGSEMDQKVIIKGPGLKEMVFSYTKSFVAAVIETGVLLYFLLAAGDLFLQKLVKILPTLRDKKKAVEITHELQQNISTFLFTISWINTCLGIFVGLAMHFLHMPTPVLWGVMAALLNFIPYFGPITGVIILLLVGSLSFDTMAQAILPSAVYLTLHLLESNFITPTILGRRLTLNPVVIFVSLIFWTWIWGIPGALLSIPVLMMIKIMCDHFKPLAPIGEFLSG